jgi:4-amino-4-deoxy-L-arabinose transferase-like glycosyltransferase
MNSAEQTSVLPADRPLDQKAGARSRPLPRVRARHLALGAVLALSAVLNTYRLSRNGWANAFYSAGVKSMLHSLHNFLFVSFDPGGLVTIDKPPLGLWVQALSARVFGMTPMSVLLPEAIIGVITVGLLYWVVTPRFGVLAGLASALTLALFPSFVAVSRENAVDPLLILLMTLACGVGLRAIESGRLRTLLGCAVLVGLAFNTKTLAAYLVVPGLALGYLVCAPATIARRAAHLLAAGIVMVAVSFAWIAMVELTPASKRPFVGGSTNNTEIGLTFGYNGFGRVGGQKGGPGQIRVLLKHGSLADIEKEALRLRALGKNPTGLEPGLRPTAPSTSKPTTGTPAHKPPPKPSAYLADGRLREPIAFGGPPGPLRMFEAGLGTQGAWMLPFALVGVIAIALWTFLVPAGEAAGERRNRRRGARAGRARPSPPESPPAALRRRDRRLAGLIVLGGWFLTELAVLSFSKGIVHPYYVSALGPGTAAMTGAGAIAFVELGRRRRLFLVLVPLAVGATVIAQVLVLREDLRYLHWFWPVLIIGAALGVLAILTVRRWIGVAMAATLALLLVVPGVYAATIWRFPVDGTFPEAGPHVAAGYGGLDIDAAATQVTKALLAYVGRHDPGSRWEVLTEASDTAAPMILLGHAAGAMGGYSGYDPALDGAGLARLVRRGEARYVVLGGAYAERGGNAASTAALRACEVVPGAAWQPPPVNPNALLLFDCKHHEAALSRQHGTL